MSTETLIDLQQFCARDDIRAYLAQPFVIDGHTYASDGHIIVRVPNGGDLETKLPENMPYSVRKMFAVAHTGFEPLPAIPERVECGWCDGTGRMLDMLDMDDDDDFCSACDGSGEQIIVIAFGAAHFQARYLHMIAALPNARMSAPTKDGPAAFVFDGGEGRLMPCRPE